MPTWVGTPGLGPLAIDGSRPWIDMQAYGAVASGLDADAATNDAAFAAAIAAVPSAGAMILCPGGSPYVVSAPIDFLGKTVNLVGSGYGRTGSGSGTIIKQKAGANLSALITSSIAINDSVVLRDFMIDGNKSQNPSAQDGINASLMQNIRAWGVRVGDCKRHCFYNVNYAALCWAEGADGSGFYSDSISSRLVLCKTVGCQDGITAYTEAILSACDIDSPTRYGIVTLEGAAEITIGDCRINDAGTAGIFFPGNNTFVTVSGGLITILANTTGIIVGRAAVIKSLSSSNITGVNIEGRSATGTMGIDIDRAAWLSVSSIAMKTLATGIRLNEQGGYCTISDIAMDVVTTPINLVAGTIGYADNQWTLRAIKGYVTHNAGATSVADGGTISHGLAATPTKVRVTPTVAGEMASVTAVAATTFTVALKTHAGAGGTTQTVYWEAEV